MAVENKEKNQGGVGLQNEATRKKIEATRAIRNQKIAALSSEERDALAILRNASNAVDRLIDRVINRKPITGEALRACAMVSTESASVCFK